MKIQLLPSEVKLLNGMCFTRLHNSDSKKNEELQGSDFLILEPAEYKGTEDIFPKNLAKDNALKIAQVILAAKDRPEITECIQSLSEAVSIVLSCIEKFKVSGIALKSYHEKMKTSYQDLIEAIDDMAKFFHDENSQQKYKTLLNRHYRVIAATAVFAEMNKKVNELNATANCMDVLANQLRSFDVEKLDSDIDDMKNTFKAFFNNVSNTPTNKPTAKSDAKHLV